MLVVGFCYCFLLLELGIGPASYGDAQQSLKEIIRKKSGRGMVFRREKKED